MEKFTHYLQKFSFLKVYLTRRNAEFLTVAVILLCAVSVFLTRIPQQEALSFNDGAITYNGYVVSNKMSGQGTLKFENGDSYVGEFKNGTFNGQGTFTSAAGWKYEGEFKNGIAHGQGTLTTESNIVYQGNFKEGIYQDEN